MKVTEVPEEAHALITHARNIQERRNEREVGLHVSDIIYCARRGWYRMHGYQEKDRDDEASLMLLSGHMLQALLVPNTPEGKITWTSRRGYVLHGSVDVPMEMASGEPYPGEIKSTRISSAGRITTKKPEWFEQIGCYAVIYGFGAAIIHALHLLGDYTGFKGPKLRSYRVEFRADEMEDFEYEMDRRTDLVMGDDIPSLHEHHHGTCELCPYHESITGQPCPGGEGDWRLYFTDDSLPRFEI